MNRLINFLMCLIVASVPIFAEAGENGTHKNIVENQRARIDALIAAYGAMNDGHLNTSGKIITIKEEDGKIIVSFMNNPSDRVYGGAARVTYDPAAGLVEAVESED